MNQTNLQSYKLQLIPYACHDILTLIRWSNKATPKSRYLPSLFWVALNQSKKYPTMKSYKTTPMSHLSTWPHVYTCSEHWANIPMTIIPLHKYVNW